MDRCWASAYSVVVVFECKVRRSLVITDSKIYVCRSNYYDVWNPMARTQFYEYSKEAMFDIGVACLWLDATEPEGFPNENVETYLASGNALFNRLACTTSQQHCF